MTESAGQWFSKHQLDLITGKILPETPEEDKFVQDNASTIVDDQVAREDRLDQMRKKATVSAKKFEDAGRPMGGVKDD
jgi:hypothetical protein